MGFGDPLGFFNAGQAAGKQSASPFEVGAGNVMDVFKQGIENQMKIAQTAAVFKGEKQYDYENDPTKVRSAKDLKAMSDTDNGTSVGGGSNGAAVTGKVSGGTTSGGPTAGTAGNMIQQSAEGFGGKKFVDPSVGAAEQQYKDALASNQKFASANSMISNLMKPMAGMHRVIGGGGLIPGTAANVISQGMGSIPGTEYIDKFNTATKDFQTNQAMQFTGNAGGISKLVSYFGHDNSPSMNKIPEKNLAILTQQRINDYALHKAHSASPFAMMPFDKLSDEQIQGIIDTARNPNMVSPEDRQVIEDQTKSEYSQAQKDIEQEETQQGPWVKNVSTLTSAIPFSGFESQNNKKEEAPKMNKVQIAAERKQVSDRIAHGGYDIQKLKNIFKQNTGEDYGNG